MRNQWIISITKPVGFQCFQWLESNNKVTDVYIARQTIVIHLIVVISVHDEQERCRRPRKQRVIEKKTRQLCISRLSASIQFAFFFNIRPKLENLSSWFTFSRRRIIWLFCRGRFRRVQLTCRPISLAIHPFRFSNVLFADFTYILPINSLLVSQVARKARNRLSSAQLTVPVTDGTDGPGKRSSKRRPTINRRPSPSRVPEEDEQDNKDEVKVVKVAKEEVQGAPPATLVVPKNVGTLAFILFHFPLGVLLSIDW